MLTKCTTVLVVAMLLSTTEVFAQRLIPFSIRTISITNGNVNSDSMDGYMDSAGNVVVPPIFEIADQFSPYGFARVRINGKWGYVNADGKVVIPAKFDAALNFSKLGVAFAKRAGLYGVIDAKGEWLILPTWPEIQPMLDVENRWYGAVKTEAGWRVFDGVKYTSEARYIDVMPFSPDGLLPVKVGLLWGFVDFLGTEIVSPRYERVSWNVSKTGKFAAQLNGLWGVADLKGKIALPFVYKNISWFFGPGDEAVVETRSAGSDGEAQYEYLAKNGTRLINEKFDAAADFDSDGVAIAKKGDMFYKLTTKAKMTKLGEFDDFENTAFPGVYRYRKGNECPMYVDQNLRPLPGWVSFLSAVNLKYAELKKTMPLVGVFGCAYLTSPPP